MGTEFAWARRHEGKFKISFENTTGDTLLVQKDAATVIVEAGEFHPNAKEGKFLIVEPSQEGKVAHVVVDPRPPPTRPTPSACTSRPCASA